MDGDESVGALFVGEVGAKGKAVVFNVAFAG